MLFIFDWDGTLGGTNGVLVTENIIAIENLTKMGHTVIVATGRHPREIVKMAKNSPHISSYIIGANGALILNSKTDRIIFEKYIDKKYNSDIIKLAKKHNSPIGYMNDKYINFVHYGHIDSKHYLKSESEKIPHFSEIDETELYSELVLMGIKINDEKIINNEYNIMRKKYKNKMSLTLGGTEFLQFNAYNTNKWEAIKWLKNHINSNDKTICFGDSENDYEMITQADIGVAMGNSVDLILKSANIIIGNCDNGGILEFANKIKKDPSILNRITK